MALTRIVTLREPIAFIIALTAISLTVGSRYLVFGPIKFFPIVAASVSLAFLPHELMHRYVARKMGCFSRFVLDPFGLMLTLATAIPFIPFKIIIPGYVLISSHYYDPITRKRIEGVSAIAGPLTNLVIALIGIVLLNTATLLRTNQYLNIFLLYLIIVNAWIAFFNLLPVPPLDGSKIISWKPINWALLFTLSIILLFLYWF